ncbi:MAG: DUF2277 domain-containing protein [Acidobacteriota bacterium]|nr:DUF2277 domain-containing protein [Acidobacteriota bacterium]
MLNTPGQSATSEEVNNAALQFVRKIRGGRKPSRANQEAFERAVLEIADSSQRLLALTERSPRRGAQDSDSA